MQKSAYRTDAPGDLVRTQFTERFATDHGWDSRVVDGWAFVPHHLPPALDRREVLGVLHERLMAAERRLSLLEGKASRLQDPHLLSGVFAQREAIYSSRIEDTFASLEDLALLKVAPDRLHDRSDTQEVANYIHALDHVMNTELPICTRLLRETHQLLLKGVAQNGVLPGEIRRSQNAIGGGGRFDQARFVPPPPDRVPGLLQNFEVECNRVDPGLPRLLHFAALHYQFETIHPFLDGNGRLGRLLITKLLCDQAQLTNPLIYVSGYFEQNREAYYNHLLCVSTKGHWLEWFAFFLEAIATQATDAIERSDKLLDLHAAMQERVRVARASPLLPRLIDLLFKFPFITAAEISEACACTPQTARNLLSRLADLKVVTEVPQIGRTKLFAAPEILALVTT